MSSNSELRDEDSEYASWEKMKHFPVEQLHAELTSNDEFRRRAAAKQLHLRGDELTFIHVKTLLTAENALTREIATFTLGQLGTPTFPFVRQSIPLLNKLLENDPDPRVRAAAASSLGHLGASESFEILQRASSDANANVRSNVAFAIGKIGHDVRSTQLLLLLTHDSDAEVVSWAILGLRLIDIDLPAIRDKFVDLLDDKRENISDEVICGLAYWRDARVLPSLLCALHRSEVYFDLIEAAENLGDARLLPRLRALRNEWRDDPPKVLDRAIAALETNKSA